jgi:hypothetical protein
MIYIAFKENMMQVFSLILLASLLSCTNTASKTHTLKKQSIEENQSKHDLISEIKRNSLVTNEKSIYVFYRRDSAIYNGTALDVRYYDYFIDQYDVLKFKQPDEIFATYHFRLTDNLTGFLLRAPSMYSSSAIDLWIFDNKHNKWLSRPIRIADRYGDGGWYFSLDGWLVDINGDGIRDLIQRRRDSIEYGENEKDSLTIRLWSNGKYLPAEISKNRNLLRTFDIPDWDGNDKYFNDEYLYGLYVKERDIAEYIQEKLNNDNKLRSGILISDLNDELSIYKAIKQNAPINDEYFYYYLNHPEYFFTYYWEGGMHVTPSNIRLEDIEAKFEKSPYGAKMRVDRLRMSSKSFELPFDDCECGGISLDNVRYDLVEGVQIYGKDNIDFLGFKDEFVSLIKAQAEEDLKNAEKTTQELNKTNDELLRGLLQSYAKPAEVKEFYNDYIADIEKIFLVDSYYELLKEDQKVFLDNLIDNLTNLSGEFSRYTSQSFGYYGDRSLFRRLQDYVEYDKHFGHEIVKVLVENMDNDKQSNVMLDGNPVPVGVMCYEALSSIVDYKAAKDDPSSSVGVVLPTATHEDLAAAKQYWKYLVKYKSYNIL